MGREREDEPPRQISAELQLEAVPRRNRLRIEAFQV
jgi:hypothetical protein